MQEALKILESVNAFYSQSFNQLIVITVAVLTFAGVILPVLILLYQKRLFRLEQEEIKHSLKLEMEIQIQKITSERFDEYKSSVSDLDKKYEKQLSYAIGCGLHLQGKVNVIEVDYINALYSFSIAGERFIVAEHEANLIRAISCLHICFDNLDKSRLQDDDAHVQAYQSFIEKLEGFNVNQRYLDDIRKLKKQFKAASQRQPN